MTSTTLQKPNTAQDRSIDPAWTPTLDAVPNRSPELGGDGKRPVPALLVDRVTKRFNVSRKKEPVVAIADVSLRLERGGTIGILGANGSGKSTLIRLVSGLLTLDEGRVEVFGHDIVREEMAVKRLINRVSVDAAFFKKLSPMENLLFAARLYGIDSKLARRNTVLITERLGIAEKRLGRPVEQMSRGMQQKIAIARALLTSPSLLLLDEPTTGLDPRSKLDVQTFIEDIRVTHDATIVLTTHDLAEAERLCGRITILNDGRVVAEDIRRSHDASIVLTTHDLDEAERLCDEIVVLNDGRIVAQGSPEELKAQVAKRHGEAPTMHAVFMTYTGRSLDEDVEEEEIEDE